MSLRPCNLDIMLEILYFKNFNLAPGPTKVEEFRKNHDVWEKVSTVQGFNRPSTVQ